MSWYSQSFVLKGRVMTRLQAFKQAHAVAQLIYEKIIACPSDEILNQASQEIL